MRNSGLEHLNDSKAFIKYSNDVNDIYKNTEDTIQINTSKD